MKATRGGIFCRVFGHRINRFRAQRAANLVAVGCQRCGHMVNLATDRW